MLPVLEPHFENESSELLDIFAKKKKPSTIIINVLSK